LLERPTARQANIPGASSTFVLCHARTDRK
jgi:hypothetical protein